MPAPKNLVHEETTITGTGDLTLANVNGKQPFSTAFSTGSGNPFDYFISNRDAAEWEVGIGYMSSGTQLVRDDVVETSVGTTAKVSFSAGTKDVTNDIPAGTQIYPALLKGHLYGLTLSNNMTDATNDIDIASGQATDDDAEVVMVLASALTKRLDASWAVGTNQGMLDGTESVAGTPDTSTWYFIYLIRRSDTGVVDVLASESASSPTMPTNYDQKRRIGSIFFGATSAIRGFTQNGDKFRWKVAIQNVSAASTGTSAVTRTLSLPVGIVVEAEITGFLALGAAGSTACYALITALDETDTAPSSSLFNVAIANQGNLQLGTTLYVKTNTSAQIRSRLSASAADITLIINTFGWIDTRGRLA